jgi:hypothetical protein
MGAVPKAVPARRKEQLATAQRGLKRNG